MKSRLLTAVGIAAVVGGVLMAQTPASPAFEVASIKPCRGNDPGAGGRSLGGTPPPLWSPGKLTVECQPAKIFIELAYVQYAGEHPHGPFAFSTEIEGAPSWLGSERYTIDAEAQNGASFETMMGPMMRALFADRFRLKIRHVTKDGPVYALNVAKEGAKLDKATNVRCSPRDPNHPLKPGDPPYCTMDMIADMNGLSEVLRPFVDRPVIDRAGINGTHEFRMMFAPDETVTGLAPEDPMLPSVFTAIQDQLGLKLESTRGPVEVLVIDHIEHPTED